MGAHNTWRPRAAGAPLGLGALVALVIGNMVGAGVFTTSGFALADLGSPFYVLLAWLVGGLLALCGALSYGALAKLMPVSGGEYYFLSRAVHPLAGFIAGWISLWAGFTGAIALAAIALEAYLPLGHWRASVPPNLPATLVILLAALAHGVQLRGGVRLQNGAVVLKLLLLAGFLAVAALATDVEEWAGLRAWRYAPSAEFSLTAFAASLMWISLSYSGFNAAIYLASEVHLPRRNVPRAMTLATLLITTIYLALNGVFVFAPAPGVIAGQEDVAALAAAALGGEPLALAMRVIIALALFTSVSAMIMAGPRVYARMAADRLMPGVIRFSGEVPAAAVAMQALLAIAVVWLTDLRELLSYLGFTLGLSAAITVASLFVVVRKSGADTSRLPGYPWAPVIFASATLLFAALAASHNPGEMLAAMLTIVSAVVLYYLTGRHRLPTMSGSMPG